MAVPLMALCLAPKEAWEFEGYVQYLSEILWLVKSVQEACISVLGIEMTVFINLVAIPN